VENPTKFLKHLLIFCSLFAVSGCDIRDPEAQFQEGWRHDNGEGVPQDDREAVKWYRLAAEQGLARAQLKLGSMYQKGEGAPKDHKEATLWYRLAAEQGLALLQPYLGWAHANGEGVP
jgi:TPR repeat protein